MIETDLYQFLRNLQTIKPIVGDRILPSKLPINTPKPAIVYFKYSRKRGRGYRWSRSLSERFQLNIYSDSYLQAKQISNSIITALDDYEGSFGQTKNVHIEITNETDSLFNELSMIVLDVEVKKL